MYMTTGIWFLKKNKKKMIKICTRIHVYTVGQNQENSLIVFENIRVQLFYNFKCVPYLSLLISIKSVLECSQKLLRGSLDFDQPCIHYVIRVHIFIILFFLKNQIPAVMYMVIYPWFWVVCTSLQKLLTLSIQQSCSRRHL